MHVNGQNIVLKYRYLPYPVPSGSMVPHISILFYVILQVGIYSKGMSAEIENYGTGKPHTTYLHVEQILRTSRPRGPKKASSPTARSCSVNRLLLPLLLQLPFSPPPLGFDCTSGILLLFNTHFSYVKLQVPVPYLQRIRMEAMQACVTNTPFVLDKNRLEILFFIFESFFCC